MLLVGVMKNTVDGPDRMLKPSAVFAGTMPLNEFVVPKHDGVVSSDDRALVAGTITVKKLLEHRSCGVGRGDRAQRMRNCNRLAAINRVLDEHNLERKPFTWTARTIVDKTRH